MFSNPFSPIFGGKPDIFFGRVKILNLFERAMVDVGSDDRAMFITGTRGSGKTALLEQLSIRANNNKRKVIDLGPENTISQIIYALNEYDGLLVTVDEIQKVPIEDVSSLCNAFQMASRKGSDIMLAVAGLPYAYSSIIKHEGCTCLRRATHEELGLFTWEEANDSFVGIFSKIKGLNVGAKVIEQFNQACYGHPYIMQLIGYHLILYINDNITTMEHDVSNEEAQVAIDNALFAYEQRALKPLLDELPNGEKDYLIKMSECLDEERLASTSEIADKFGVDQNKLSRQRSYLIDHGIIASPERGKVMFCIPYLADYVKKAEYVSDAITVARQRRV